MSILILGKNGQVGWELCRALSYFPDVRAIDRDELDVTNEENLRNLVRGIHPFIIINATGYTAVDEAERAGSLAHMINARTPEVLAEEADRLGAYLIHYSTDYVFDGEKAGPYKETDIADPLNVYGRTKLAGETAITRIAQNHIILRCSWIYSSRRNNFLLSIIEAASQKEMIEVVDDCIGSPTAAQLVADVTALIARQIFDGTSHTEVSGIYHLSSLGETSWHGYASFIVDEGRRLGMPLRLESSNIQRIGEGSYGSIARRPHNSRMNTDKLRQTFGITLPEWQWGAYRALTEIAEISRFSSNFLGSSRSSVTR